MPCRDVADPATGNGHSPAFPRSALGCPVLFAWIPSRGRRAHDCGPGSDVVYLQCAREGQAKDHGSGESPQSRLKAWRGGAQRLTQPRGRTGPMVQRLLAEDVRQRLGLRWSTHAVRLPLPDGPEAIPLAAGAEALTWTRGGLVPRTDAPRALPSWTSQGVCGECRFIARFQRTRSCRPFASKAKNLTASLTVRDAPPSGHPHPANRKRATGGANNSFLFGNGLGRATWSGRELWATIRLVRSG